MPTWALAFSVALLVALGTVSRCRRLALSIGFVDVPDRRKSHTSPIPYMGGVGLILGVIGGLFFEYPIGSKVTLIALAATLLGTIGLFDDDRTVSPGYRFLAEVAAATAATAAGLRVNATGIEALDFFLTIVWIVGITNALNLLDNMDGLAAGLASVAAAAVFVLAVAAGQPVIATLSAATVGACLGFLVFNSPPASIFMGDAGSLFLGFVLAVITIDVDVALSPPHGFLIPLMILAIPVLDTTTVTLARLRRRRGVLQGGKDHLSHRLVARGHTRAGAVKVLVACEAALGLLAILAGRDIVALPLAVAASLAIVAGLAIRTVPVQVYEEPLVGLPRPLRLALVVAVVGLPVFAAPAVAAMLLADDQLRAGSSAAVEALEAVERGDAATAVRRFDAARASLERASDRLHGPVTSTGLLVPGVASNLRAARALASAGAALSRQGELVAAAYAAPSVQITGQSVPVDAIGALGPLLTEADAVLDRARIRLAAVETGFVVPALRDPIRATILQADRHRNRTETAVRLATQLPDVFGAAGPRRYFVAFLDTSELRGVGGRLTHWGELEADRGQLRFTRSGALGELAAASSDPAAWSKVDSSPDFPTVAAEIGRLYPSSGGAPIDGVVGVDSAGLATLLALTGPVAVPTWPDAVSAANAVDVTVRAPDRQAFGDVAAAVAGAFTRTVVGVPAKVGSALGPGAREQHLRVWLSRPEEQALMIRLGIDGGLGQVAGDTLLVVDQRLDPSRIDAHLQRTVTYRARLQPSAGSRRVSLDGRVHVALENLAEAGENRTELQVYSPLATVSASVDGAPRSTTTRAAHGRSAHSLTLAVPPRQTVDLEMVLRGEARFSEDGWYRLDLLRQTSVRPDAVAATISLPRGWRFAEARGALVIGPDRREARFEGPAPGPVTIWVRVERTGLGRIWDKLLRVG